jgi:hypothetical protein
LRYVRGRLRQPHRRCSVPSVVACFGTQIEELVGEEIIYTLRSASQCIVQIDDKRVSPRHVAVQLMPSGNVSVKDITGFGMWVAIGGTELGMQTVQLQKTTELQLCCGHPDNFVPVTLRRSTMPCTDDPRAPPPPSSAPSGRSAIHSMPQV